MSSSYERRGCATSNEVYNGLTFIQHHEVDQLERCGAMLLFVRNGYHGDVLAVLRNQKKLMTVDFDGNVKFQPKLTIR
jgi:hypothetical protein